MFKCTEEEAGEEQRECSNCNAYETREIEKLQHTHSYTRAVVEPTCTEQGYTTYTCACGDFYNESYTDALGHNYEDGICTRCKDADPYSGTCGENLTWVFDEETGTLTISGTGTMTNYTPDYAPWYSFNKEILYVVFPEGITTIGDGALEGCENISNIVIPDGVTYIGRCAFWCCKNLESITIPESVTTIEGGAFFSCENLESITLPSGITAIDNTLFYSCTSLSSITIPEGVTSIGNESFSQCTNLVSVVIPDSVTFIDEGAFVNCSKLTSLSIPQKVTSIGAEAFAGCSSITAIIIPKSAGQLGHGAFMSCTSLSNITFEGDAPEFLLLTSQGEYDEDSKAFYDVTATAYYPANNPTWTEDVMLDYGGNITWLGYDGESTYSGFCGENLAWEYNEESGKLSVSGTGEMYNADKLDWTVFSDEIQTVEIGSGATSIGAYAFSAFTKLTDVEIPSTVMAISYNAFENCRSLTAIDLPDQLDSIGENAFQSCARLKTIAVPESVMEISYAAFRDCTSLTEIDFPSDLEMICSNAFRDCSSLAQMRFTGNAPEIQSNAFYNVLADAYYPSANATWTEDKLLNYGGNLTWIAEGGVVVPDNSCGENITWAFDNGTLTISGTESIARVNGNSVMDDYASAEETPWYAYQDQIVTVVIESTVDSVGKNAFAGCSNLTTVIIEEGVSEIDSTAFADCESLEACYYAGSSDNWEDLGADVGEAVVHTESAEPEAHTETKTTVAPTCTEQGYDLYTCSCGAERRDNIVAATGHIWDEGTITQEPTAEVPGIMTYECTVCEETREEIIPALSAVQRIAGADRIETALAVAKELKAVLGVEKFDSIILAAGGSGSDQTKFADALSGSYLASAKKAPILLYTKGNLSSKNLTFIEENLSDNGTIYLLGGNVSIPAEVEEALNASGYTTKRLGGADRYQTNLIILDEAGIDSTDEILIAGGQAFADSLSASATGLPIMLVNGTKTKLTTAQIEFLQNLRGKKVTILGGTAAVSADLEAAIEEAIGYEADRIYGDTREHTSAMIAKRYFSDAEFAIIAYSKMYPDGLAGGVLANALLAPLLLTKAGSESIANNYITEAGIEAGYVLGGTAVMTDDTARAVFGLAEDAVISQK